MKGTEHGSNCGERKVQTKARPSDLYIDDKGSLGPLRLRWRQCLKASTAEATTKSIGGKGRSSAKVDGLGVWGWLLRVKKPVSC